MTRKHDERIGELCVHGRTMYYAYIWSATGRLDRHQASDRDRLVKLIDLEAARLSLLGCKAPPTVDCLVFPLEGATQ